MEGVRSFAIPLGHSKLRHDLAACKILSATLGSVHFHLGYIGESASVKITRSFFLGLYQTTWEALGPADSIHRMPNGATVWIGKQRPSQHNDVPVTGLMLQCAPAMWSEIVPIAVVAE